MIEPLERRTAAAPRGGGYSWYVVLILALTYGCHSMDRSLPGILIEPIKHEFSLSDGQLGLFSGLAYALAFSLVILPMGYISDRLNRRNLLVGLLVAWSVATALGGLTRSYVQLVLGRLGVGAAEAGAAPLALPMISDLFPPSKRSFPLGLFYMSSPIGVLAASVVGGYVAAEHGWRTAFFLGGIPGLILAVLLLFTVREPKRGGAEVSQPEAAEPPAKLRETFAYLTTSPALICLASACALLGLVNITMGAWMGSFFIRAHGLGLKEVGLILGIGGGLCGMVATPTMGFLADRLSLRDPRWSLRIVWIASVLSLVFTMGMLFVPAVGFSIALFVLADLTRQGFPAPIFAVVMANTPVRMRGTMMSIVQLVTSVVGFGLGPLVTGLLSDFYGGGVGIRYALADSALAFVIIIVLLWLTNRLLHGRGAQPKDRPHG